MAARTAIITRSLAVLGAALALTNAGCFTTGISKYFHKDKHPSYRPSDRPDQDTSPSKMNGELAAAHELFRKEEYSAAARAFKKISDNTENSPATAEEAFYYEAECERLRNHLATAEPIYKKQLNEFPSGAFKQQACQRLYDIAIYWLKDTDIEITERSQGKKSFVMPAQFRMHLDSSKPTIDAEDRALQALEVVHYSDMTGPLADKAIFLAGYVKFYREDYKDADHYFTALLQYHKDSELAPKACQLAIVCKTLAAGGPDYDGRKVAEARELIDTAMRNYPELTRDEEARKKMMSHLDYVTATQAEKDLKRAEFYERTKHAGSAYYVYEMMRRHYPNTKYVAIADERMARLKPAMEKAAANDEKPGVLDQIHARWNRLWGLDPDEDKRGPTLTSPNALPAGNTPGLMGVP